jgi:hypothetical protein
MQPVPEETLRAIEQNLHVLIRSRASRFVDQYAVPLPSLAAMLAGEATELFRPAGGSTGAWFFAVPGMYGGFRLRWLAGGSEARLESLSFCRVVGGSGQWHEVTSAGCELVEVGFA